MIDTTVHYFIVHDWMTKLFPGKPSKRDVYALIFGCWKNGNGCWFGSQKGMADITGHATSKCNDYLKELLAEGYICRKDIGSQIQYTINRQKLESIQIDLSNEDTTEEQYHSGTTSIPQGYNNNTTREQKYKYNNIKNKLDTVIQDFEATLGEKQTATSDVAETLDRLSAQRHNTANNPHVYMSDDERAQMRSELAQYGEYAYLATLKAFNNCNKQLISDGLNPYAPGIDGFRRYIERYGISTTNPNAPIKARI